MRRSFYQLYYFLIFDRTKVKTICLLLITVASVIWLYKRTRLQTPVFEFTKYQILLSKFNVSSTPGCQIPALNPWDPAILKYYEKPKPLICKSLQSNVSYVENGHLKLYKEFIGNVKCRYRYFGHNNNINDFDVKYDEWIEFEKDVKLEKDFVEVECSKNSILSIKFYSYHWNTVVAKETNLLNKTIKEESTDTPSVIIIGIDSQSRSNFIRQLPKTHKLLQRMGFIDMQSHVKVADNTFGNLLAVLLGKRGSTYKEFANEILDAWYMYFDEYEFVWKNFVEHGYVTLFAEDRPDIATFDYKGYLYGFKQTPVDHYMRPYWIAAFYSLLMRRSNPYCYDFYPSLDLHLNYLQDFLTAYKNKRKFAFWWNQDISHEHLKVGVMDMDYVKFFEANKENFENSIVFVLADHGNRYDLIRETVTGRLESRLPILSVLLPKTLHSKYPHLIDHLQENSRSMTTQFDLHATLHHILNGNFDSYKLDDLGKRAYSILGPIPTNRSCYQANVPEDYCPCIQEVEIPIEDAKSPASALLGYANQLLETHNEGLDKNLDKKKAYFCDRLELEKISYASVRMPNQKIIKEHVEKAKEVPELLSAGIEFSYRISIQTKPPSNALIEGVVVHNLESGRWTPTGEIERNNKYGNTSHCVTNRILKKICYCVLRSENI